MAEILSTISTISFITAGVFLVLAVVFWVRFKIPFVIGDLSGKNARKSMEQMRKKNEEAGAKTFGKEKKSKNKCWNIENVKEIDGKEPDEGTAPLMDRQATKQLMDPGVTVLLQEQADKKGAGKKITLLEEALLIHTEEVIV